MIGLIGLEAPAFIVENDLPVIRDTLKELVKLARQTFSQLTDGLVGIRGHSDAFAECLANLLPL